MRIHKGYANVKQKQKTIALLSIFVKGSLRTKPKQLTLRKHQQNKTIEHMFSNLLHENRQLSTAK